MLAWHFLKDDMTAGHGNEPAWAEGETRTLPRKPGLKVCDAGLYHWSPTPAKALKYAPGNTLCLVKIADVIDRQTDKFGSLSRTLIKAINVEPLVREIICDSAEERLNSERKAGREPDARSWKSIKVARQYLAGRATKKQLAKAYQDASVAASYASVAAAYAAYA